MSDEPDPHEARLRVARMFLRVGQPLGAAVLLGELIREHSRTPEVWCGLAAALLGARGGTRPRRGLEIWAGYVLRDGKAIVGGTPFAKTCTDLAAGIAAAPADDLFAAAEMDAMLAFLVAVGPVLPAAIDRLPTADRQHAVTLLADHSRYAAPVVIAAIANRWGVAVARIALRRAGRFVSNPELAAALTAATRAPHREALEPFLGRALDELAAHTGRK